MEQTLASMSSAIVETWLADADATSLTQVSANGDWIESRTNDPDATTKSAWRLFSGAHAPKEMGAGFPVLDPKATYIFIDDFGGEFRFCRLDLVNATALHETWANDDSTWPDVGSNATFTRVT